MLEFLSTAFNHLIAIVLMMVSAFCLISAVITYEEAYIKRKNFVNRKISTSERIQIISWTVVGLFVYKVMLITIGV